MHGLELRTPSKAGTCAVLSAPPAPYYLLFMPLVSLLLALTPETEAQFLHDKEEKQANRSLKNGDVYEVEWDYRSILIS